MTLIQKSGNMTMFEVYDVDLNPTRGAEMYKVRPAVIISPDAMNRNLRTVLIAPLTHTLKGYPSRVPLHFNTQQGEVALDQIRAVDKSRLIKKRGKIDPATAANIKAVLRTMFS
jgi:mRNA interferase MazF